MKRFQHTLIYAIIFFSFFDLFTQLPIMSTFAISIGASSFIAGLVVGAYSLSNTFGNILSGLLTDKKGPVKLLLTGLFLTGFVLLLYLFVENAILLLVIRFVHGFVAGLIVPAAFAYLANTMDQEKRGKNSAISGAFVGAAAIIGPAFSGILASYKGEVFVFLCVAIIGFLLAVISLFALKGNKITINREREQIGVSFNRLLKNVDLLKAFSGAFFLMFSQGVLAYLLPLYVKELGYESNLSGMLLSVFGIVAVLFFLLPTNKVFDKLQPVYTMGTGIALMGISLILISQFRTSGMLFLALACYGIGFAFLFPSINSLLIDATTEDIRGKAYGYFYAAFSLGVVAGSSLIGWLPFSITSSFIFTGIILLCVACFVFYSIKHSREKQLI